MAMRTKHLKKQIIKNSSNKKLIFKKVFLNKLKKYIKKIKF